MTTEQKIRKLKNEGWNVVFNEEEHTHEADRGCVKYTSKNISNLYKSN